MWTSRETGWILLFEAVIRITTLLCIMAGVLIMAAFYSVSRQKMYMDACSSELQDSLLQAQEVKCDLQEIMNTTLVLSQQIADNLELKNQDLSEVDNAVFPHIADSESFQTGSSSASSLSAGEQKAGHDKMRVHELADELGISSREMLQICEQMGFPIKHHMRVLNEEQIRLLRGRKYESPKSADYQEEAGPEHGPELRVIETVKNDGPPVISISRERQKEFSLEEVKNAHPYIAVRTLYEQGYNSKDIARILNRGQGEVNLILNLTRKKIG